MESLLEALALGGSLEVVGSSSRQALWPSDLDCICEVNATRATVVTRMRALLRRLAKLQRLRVREIKWGGAADAPIKWTALEFLKAKPAELAAALNADARTKLDVAVFAEEEARWISVEVLYALRDGSTQLSFRPTAENDTREEEAAAAAAVGDAWLALKRQRSLKTTPELEAVLNGPLGALAQSAANLELIRELCASAAPPRAALGTGLRAIAVQIRRNPLLSVKQGRAEAARLKEAADRVERDGTVGALQHVAAVSKRVMKRVQKKVQEEAHKTLSAL
jgi:hypothetical protein